MKPDFFPDFAADWRDMLFVHYRFAPEVLEPHVAFPLDLYAGEAYVSLVLFRLERMRPWASGWGGRLLCRPISDHHFLNLRTYVRDPLGPGIQFLAEWIPNEISLRLGPRVYGLPYRRGRFTEEPLEAGALRRRMVCAPGCSSPLRVELAASGGVPATCESGSLSEFLLERYLAFTSCRGIRRFFRVRHAAWEVCEPARFCCRAGLVEEAFPWFRQGELVGAHYSTGVEEVRMSRPRKLNSARKKAIES